MPRSRRRRTTSGRPRKATDRTLELAVIYVKHPGGSWMFGAGPIDSPDPEVSMGPFPDPVEAHRQAIAAIEEHWRHVRVRVAHLPPRGPDGEEFTAALRAFVHDHQP